MISNERGLQKLPGGQRLQRSMCGIAIIKKYTASMHEKGFGSSFAVPKERVLFEKVSFAGTWATLDQWSREAPPAPQGGGGDRRPR